jgi:hypothetical protein
MPRGVPKSGFRAPRGAHGAAKIAKILNVAPAQIPVVVETDAEIEAKLADRFEILETMTDAAISGDARAVIVSGPAGLGKSYTVEKALNAWDPNAINHRVVKGYIKATGLFKLLYAHRAAGQVLVFDDADEVFLDDTAINLLKAACDTSDRRVISYMTEYNMIDEDSAERLPKSFEFEGTIIFITNYDFDAMIERGSKLAPHLQALVSRAHYIDMAMKTKRDYLIRIRQVIRHGLLRNINLSEEAQLDVVDFIEDNQERLRELSLRMALKIGAIRRKGAANWQKVARVTCCRN